MESFIDLRNLKPFEVWAYDKATKKKLLVSIEEARNKEEAVMRAKGRLMAEGRFLTLRQLKKWKARPLRKSLKNLERGVLWFMEVR
jgi:hypothetical protein